MNNLSHISVIKELLSKHGFTFSKALGQNFLINPSVCPRMAELGGAFPNVGVLEIGAGIGVLTCELAQRAEKVVCVEIDQRLRPILEETLGDYSNIQMVYNDVLKVDLHQLLKQEFGDREVVVCANLPYYITSPIIMYLLESRLPVTQITVMVQKEAAQRICAEPGTRDTGAISVAMRYYCNPRLLFPVSRGSFMPAPDVDSAVIALDVLPTPPVQVLEEKMFFAVVKGAFSQRRKTLPNCLSGAFPLSKGEIISILELIGLSSNSRAEELSLEQFAAIANALTQALSHNRPSVG